MRSLGLNVELTSIIDEELAQDGGDDLAIAAE